MIGLASKSLDEVEAATEEKARNKVRRQFWTELLKAAAPKVARFANISPSHFHYISAGSGLRGVPFNFVGTRSYGRVELYIDRGDRDENKAIFDELYQQRAAIETSFGSSLTWERLNNKRASRIKSEMPGDVFDDAQRAEMIEFMVDAMSKLETSFKEPLAAIQRKFRARSSEE